MAVWQEALSWCSIQVSAISGRTRWNLFLSRSRTSRYYCLLAVCPWGTNSLWTTPWLSKKQISTVLSFDLLIFAFTGRGELPLRTLSFGVRIVFENPRFIACYDMFEKIYVIFDAFKKVQAHIPSVLSSVHWWGFLGPAWHKFSACPVLRSKFRGRFGDFKFNTLLIILTVKRRSDLTRSLTLVTFSSVFWRARSSRTRFVFHTLTAIQKCFTPPKNLCPWQSMLSISPFFNFS